MPSSSSLGKFGEDLACDYLKRAKYKIICRNFRTRYGEIDIIAKKGKVLVFVEVKYGSKDAYLRVNKEKFKRILITSQIFLRRNENLEAKSYRIDVISISKERKVVHFKDVAKDFWR